MATAAAPTTIERLPREALLEVFKRMEPRDAVRAGAVCRRFHEVASDGRLWSYYIEHGPSAFTTPDLCAHAPSGKGGLRQLYWELQTFYQRAVCAFDITKEGAESSPSLDDHTIGTTLQQGSGFWCSADIPGSHVSSSSNSNANDSSEDEAAYLVYRLKQPIAVVTSVELSTYPGYAPSAVTVSVGFSQEGPWGYTSPAFPVLSVADEQEFELGRRLCVGGYVRLGLSGAHRTQRIAVRHVRIVGTIYGAISPGALADALFSLAAAEGAFCGRCTKRPRIDGSSNAVTATTTTTTVAAAEVDAEALNKAWRGEAQALLAGLKYLRENRVVVEDLFRSGRVAEAIEYLLTLPSFHKLRGRRTLHLLEACTERNLPQARDTLLATRPGCPVPPVWEFLTRAAAAGRLNTYESIALALHAPEYGTKGLAEALDAAEKLTPSEDLGALFLSQGLLDLALSAFLRAGAFERAAHALMLQGAYARLVALAVQSRTSVAWPEVMDYAAHNSPRAAIVELATALLFPPAQDTAAAVVGLPLPQEEVFSRLGIEPQQLSQKNSRRKEQ